MNDIPTLTLELKRFGVGGGHFVISTILIQQNYFEVGKKYQLCIKEAE